MWVWLLELQESNYFLLMGALIIFLVPNIISSWFLPTVSVIIGLTRSLGCTQLAGYC